MAKIEDNKFTIRIESILGGHSKSLNFSANDEYRDSLGIDPGYSATFGPNPGWIMPVMVDSATTSSQSNIMWFIPNPKDDTVYVYDAVGSVYTSDGVTLTGIGDLNDGGTSHGNGAAYYDNYIYFARDTTIARYGPLDGTPSFTDDYWVGTLGKTALTNTSYPFILSGNVIYPNHVMHRHSDGRLYFADVTGNQGILNYISTTKTSVEGDTDNGSKYNAVDFPYGMWPTAIESYGINLAVALFEGPANPQNAGVRWPRAKLSFWDTVNPNTYDFITETEFPDPFISALLNTNGVLYAFSGENYQNLTSGVRITRFVGGYSFEQVFYLDGSFPPFAGAVDGILNKIIFGGYGPYHALPCVWQIGSKDSPVSNKVFNIIRLNASSGVAITALKFAVSNSFSGISPLIGSGTGVVGSGSNHLDYVTSQPSTTNTLFWDSQLYKIGKPFKITKIRIPLAVSFQSLNSPSSNQIVPSITTDNTTTNLTTITNTKFPTQQNIIIRPTNLTGSNRFYLSFEWDIKETFPIALPITIEGEYLQDDG